MDTLKDIVRQAVEDYAGKAYNGEILFMSDPSNSVFSTIGIGTINGKRFNNIGIFVRLTGDLVVIDHDINDKPLVDALVQAGIPRAQIILAYAGEPIPEAV